LNGHHNVYGKVFENLDKLVSGDEIFIYGNDFHIYQYVVSNTMILPERDVSFEERLENARWILPSEDERITLITCWPYFSNTHRLIIVASPIGFEPIPITNERN
jgi:sortase A